MPWKPIAPEARERMERIMPPSNRPYRTAAMDDGLQHRMLRLALHDVLDGLEPEAAAHRHGIALAELRSALAGLSQAAERGPEPHRASLRADRRRLRPEQEHHLHTMIRGALPDALGASERLWTRESVRWLIHRETGLMLPERTLSTYLERWGFAPQKPMRAMAAAQPARMREWLKRDYPVIALLARESGGRIAWWGAAPLLARRQGKQLPGQGPGLVESPLWEPGRYGLLFIMGNRGHLQWRVHEGAPTTALAIDLLERAADEEARPLHVILPVGPVHDAPEFTLWAQGFRSRITFHLFQPEPSASARHR